MNNRSFLKFLLLLIVAMAGISFGSQAKASALLCYVLVPAVNNTGQSTDCLYGQQNPQTSLTSLSGSSDTLKSQFISKIQNFEKGQINQQVGAKFIENLISGNSGMDWKTRLLLSDITLSIASTYNYSDNTGYDPLSNSDEHLVNDQGIAPALVFIIEGANKLVIKLTCGNVLDDPKNTALPAPPIIRGYKVDTTGNQLGSYSADTISATNSIPADDSAQQQPFIFSIQNNPDPSTGLHSSTISAKDQTSGWKVAGSTYTSCNTANIASNGCPALLPADPSLFSTSSSFLAGNSHHFPVLKDGYIYDMRWIYQKPTIDPATNATITGTKIGSDGSLSGPFTADVIQVSNTGNGDLSSDSSGNGTYSLSISAGNLNVSPQNLIPGWTASPTSALITTVAGKTYTQNFVYTKSTNICTGWAVPSPYHVSIPLDDVTPVISAPPAATTTPSSLYLQQTTLNTSNIVNVSDTSTVGNRLLSLTNLISKPSANPAVVDFSPFVAGYPYDNNQATVAYTSAYTVTPYISASSPSFYTCADGSTPNPTTHICTSSINLTTSSIINANKTTTYCSNNTVGTWNGTNCGTYGVNQATYSCSSGSPVYSTPPVITSCDTSYNYTSSSNHWTCHSPGNTAANWSNGLTCLSVNRTSNWCWAGGTNTSGSTCHVTASISPTIKYTVVQVAYPSPGVTSTTYSCTSPDTAVSGDATKCTHITSTTTYNYTNATAWYNYSQNGAPYAQLAPGTASSSMPPCFARGFSVTSVSAPTNVNLNNPENPTSATVSGSTASVKFYYTSIAPTVGLRLPMSVKLNYSYGATSSATSCSLGGSLTVSGSPGVITPVQLSPGNCSVTPPLLSGGIAIGGSACVSASVSPTGTTINPDGSFNSNNGVTLTSSSSCSGPVVNEPYIKVFGGDVSVGGGFGNSCSNNISSGIFGWNVGANSAGVYSTKTQAYAGAGTQYLLSSPGNQSGVTSNQNNPNATAAAISSSGSPNPDPLGLTLANDSKGPGMSGFTNCLPDYYSSLPATQQTFVSLTTSLDSSSGTYKVDGNLTITKSKINRSNSVTVYVNGDLNVSDNINFVDGNGNADGKASYSSVNQIPSLIFIVSGNIYISNSVTDLSGIFIAQPTATGGGGNIYDCSVGFSQFSTNQLYGSGKCNNQLTINGSFVANKVVLNRTYSSLRSSSNTETNTSTNASETFNYTPALWLNTSLPLSTTSSTKSGYDALINLPPVL